jgi:CRP/FNR family cyclic AMP-dependent transcriptional regulator
MGLFSRDEKIDALGQAPLFAGLSRKELTALARGTEDLELPAGSVLCREGGLAREFFVIVDGSIEVTRGGKRLAIRGGGDFVGEIGLITHSKRAATVTATTPVRCFVLTSGEFRRVLDDNPGIQRKVMKALGERVAALDADPAQ